MTAKTEKELQAYKEAQQKRIAAYVVGKKDPNGNEITSIYIKGDEFVIFEIKTTNLTESIKVKIDTETEDDPKGLIHNYAQIRPIFTDFKGVIYKIQTYSSFKARAAHLIAHALLGGYEDSNKKFQELITEINAQYALQTKYRVNYLVTALSFVGFMIILSIITYLTKMFDDYIELRNLLYVVTGGSIGGFISLSRKLKDMVFEQGVDTKMYILYAIERMFISIFAGVVAYLAIRSNLVFGVIKQLKGIFGYLIFAIAAGFSETLVPNLLIKLEEKQK